jgi:hypothetical protein
MELPTDTKAAPRAVFWNTAVGKSFGQNRGFGRTWSPMIEVLADRELAQREKVNWDLLPQFQVTLSRRQHIRANIGVRIPVNNTVGRSTALVLYLLWDFFDGGLFDGWR